MIGSIDTDDVLEKLNEVRESFTEKLDEAVSAVKELADDYENRISDLQGESCNKDDEIDELQNKLDELSSGGDLELYATSMLTSFTGHEPSLGDVLALKEDLEKLLTTKYNVSLGNL